MDQVSADFPYDYLSHYGSTNVLLAYVRKDFVEYQSDQLTHDGSKNAFLAYVRKDFVEYQSD